MKFTCERALIMKEIGNAYEIISLRNTVSILANVYFRVALGKLIIRATDLKVFYESSINIDSVVDGAVTVFCDKLHNILRALPDGEIEFTTSENNTLTIRPLFKNISFNLKGISTEKYPAFDKPNAESFFSFPRKDFLDLISKTLFAVSTDETRYFMNGVLLEKKQDLLKMVATDGRRLALAHKRADNTVSDFEGIIVPPKILNVVKRQVSKEGEFLLAISEKNIFIQYANTYLSSNLIDAQFPNYDRVIPKNQEKSLNVIKKDLEEGLKRVSLLVEQKSRRIYLEISSNKIIVRSSEGDIGTAQEELSCDYDGINMTLAINYSYLLDPLYEMESEKVTIEFTDPGKAISLKPIPEKNYFHIIMPMQSD